jgi:hypothetical protein
MATAFTFTVIDEALYNKRFDPPRSKQRPAQTWRHALANCLSKVHATREQSFITERS